MANRLAQDMGVKAEFIPTKWSGIIPALLTGKFDIIIGGMGILPERNLKVNFSIPYDHTGMSIVAHKKLASGFKKLERLQQPQRLHRRPDGDDRRGRRQEVDAEGQTAALRRRIAGDPGASPGQGSRRRRLGAASGLPGASPIPTGSSSR